MRLFYILFLLTILCKQGKAQDSISNKVLQNESWVNGRAVGDFESFYFGENGRFEHSIGYSAGVYHETKHWGTYEFDAETNILNLKVEGRKHEGVPIIRFMNDILLESFSITNITNDKVTINRGTAEMEAKILWTDLKPSFHRESNVMNLKDDSTPIVSIKVGLEKKVKVAREDIPTILNTINTAIPSKELNDGRMQKMPEPDYIIFLKRKGDSAEIQVQFWGNVMQFSSSSYKWYNLVGNNSHFFEILAKCRK